METEYAESFSECGCVGPNIGPSQYHVIWGYYLARAVYVWISVQWLPSSNGQLTWSASATTLISVWNTRVFRTALTAVTEPCTLWRRITRYPLPRRRVALHTYLLYFVVTYTHYQNDTCVTLFAGAAVVLKPFTQRLAIDDKPGSTWERRRHVWEHLESQSWIQFVFSSMYLCIYVSI